jgi:RND superfamily putative drug exporter
VTTTGNQQISLEWSAELNADFVRTEGIVLPIAMVALGAQLRSYRHMGIALLNLIVTLLLAFAVLVPVAQKGALDIDPSALLIMASLGIALSFDYSLFLLSRFREERAGPRAASKLDSVERALHTSGHAVALSGSILAATYLLLACFPNAFLRSVGVTCAAVTAAAVVTNPSIVPCLLL